MDRVLLRISTCQHDAKDSHKVTLPCFNFDLTRFVRYQTQGTLDNYVDDAYAEDATANPLQFVVGKSRLRSCENVDRVPQKRPLDARCVH